MVSGWPEKCLRSICGQTLRLKFYEQLDNSGSCGMATEKEACRDKNADADQAPMTTEQSSVIATLQSKLPGQISDALRKKAVRGRLSTQFAGLRQQVIMLQHTVGTLRHARVAEGDAELNVKECEKAFQQTMKNHGKAKAAHKAADAASKLTSRQIYVLEETAAAVAKERQRKKLPVGLV